jgi:hypothetical protein
MSGCRPKEPPEPPSVSDTVERGPFSFSVEVTPRQVWVGDPVTIDLRVHTPNEHVVQFPSEQDLGDLLVRHVETTGPRPAADGGLDRRQVFTAESLASGVVEVPSLTVKYGRKPTEPGSEPSFAHELVAKPLEIEVRSALTTQDSVLNPRDITGTLLPPREPLSAWVWLAIIGAMLAGSGAIAALVVWLRRRARRPPPPVLPEVWALRALGELVVADLLERGQAREFYYRLSEIVRVYVERKFGLAAPEMTTEEFLVALARDRGAVPYDADRLRVFLEACDLVKYAALYPRQEDAEHALGSARAFVDATAAAAQRATAAPETPPAYGETAA